MKKFISILIVAVLIVSMAGIMTASAGTSISGSSEVQAGGTYTYNITVSANASSIGGTVTCGGIFSGSSANFWKDSGSGMNEDITATCSITVTVSGSAQPGDTGTISVSGEGSTVDSDTFAVGTFAISGSKTASVPTAATSTTAPASTPKKTKDPNATPSPTEEPEGWDLIAINVEDAEENTPMEATMEDDTSIPESLLVELINKGIDLTIDFGTYKCTVNAESLTEIEGIDSLDLGLTFEMDEALSNIAGGKDVYQLHFTHEGQLPGRFTYSFKAENHEPGDVLYLYYYYGIAGVLEGKQQAVVDEDGMVTFDIYHCSSYFVSDEVIEDAYTNFLDVEEEEIVPIETIEPTTEPTPEPTTEPTPEPVIETANESAVQGISVPGFVAALVGAVLVTILLTMLFCRAGMFKQSEEEKQAKAARKQAKAARKQAKKGNRVAKEESEAAKRKAKQRKMNQKLAKKAQALAEKEARRRSKRDK